MTLERPDPKHALGRLLGPAEPEVGCDTCFDLLDRYVELEVAGENADGLLPGLRAHLAGCPACHEEHESLLALVRSEPSRDPLASAPARPHGAARRTDGEALDDTPADEAADDLADGTLDPDEVDADLEPWDEGADDEL